MSTLPTRIASAVIAIFLILIINHFFSTAGIIYFGSAICSIGIWEYQKIAFKNLAVPKVISFLFLSMSVILLAMSQTELSGLMNYWSIFITIYFSAILWIFRNKTENSKILSVAAFSSLGFIYVVMLPSFALQLLQLKQGLYWFLYLVCVVAAGDVFAYFGGIWFGKTKLMVQVSPNKTFAGSFAGVLGSVFAGAIVAGLWLDTAPLILIIPLSACAAMLAQCGDLFESLLKRVADVKDSGNLMPGHGGVLDRLDGVYFASPLVFAAASLLSSSY